MTIHFTSDTHYYHRKVIPLCKRPFGSIEEMHETLIRNWHEQVQDGDTVYVLGDFAFCGVERGREILERLRGSKKLQVILVRGNHDQNPSRCRRMGFDEVLENATFYWSGRKFNLSHYPYRMNRWDAFLHKLRNFWKFWRRVKYKELRYLDRRPVNDGRWLLHGHVHQSWKVNRRMLNVGVDVHAFRPISIREVAAIIGEREVTHAVE